MSTRFVCFSLLLSVADAVLCSSFDERSCTGCTSSGECEWDADGATCLTIADSPNCGGIGITSVDDGMTMDDGHHHDDAATDDGVDLSGACQSEGSYPLYCTEEESNGVSPDGSSHAMAGHFMPDGVTMYHGDYTGDADACDCELDESDESDESGPDSSESESDHDDHDDHDHDDHDDQPVVESDGASRTTIGVLLAAIPLALSLC